MFKNLFYLIKTNLFNKNYKITIILYQLLFSVAHKFLYGSQFYLLSTFDLIMLIVLIKTSVKFHIKFV